MLENGAYLPNWLFVDYNTDPNLLIFKVNPHNNNLIPLSVKI